MATEDTDWLQALPRSVRQRFEGLGNYIKAVLDEARIDVKRDVIQRIQLIVFVRELSAFLHDGSDAAAAAVDSFRDFGVESFQIGSETFAGRNDAVLRGARLADGLRNTLSDLEMEISAALPGVTLKQQILNLAKELSAHE